MKKFLAEVEQVFMSLFSAAVAMGVLTDDAIIPHRWQHTVNVLAGVIIYAAYRSTPAKVMTAGEIQRELEDAEKRGSIHVGN
jgi:hypothetical protein